MAELQVDIVTPLEKVWSGQAVSLVAPGWEGEFNVLPGHDIVLTLLRAGIVTVHIDARTSRRFVVGRGFVEAGPDRVVVLTDSADDPESVDTDAARVELDACDAMLMVISGADEEWRTIEARREMAEARLQA